MGRLQLGIKRAIDIAVTLVAIAVLWPVFLILMTLVHVGSRGPTFIKQERVGRHCRTFTMYKFRTMHAGINPLYPGREHLTWFGRWTRRFGIDEMPQMWNVLKGDMSLVGATRPLQPHEHFVHFGDFAQQIATMRPSWLSLYSLQVSLKTSAHTSFTGVPRLEYDQVAVGMALAYIEDWNLGRDVVVVFKTAVVTVQMLKDFIRRRLPRRH